VNRGRSLLAVDGVDEFQQRVEHAVGDGVAVLGTVEREHRNPPVHVELDRRSAHDYLDPSFIYII
jgi:hypothetical protein